MPLPQPGPVVNLLMIVLFGVGGYFAGTFTKPPEKKREEIPAQKGIVAATSTAGNFSADARKFAAVQTAGLPDLESLFTAYGGGSRELTLLAAEVMEKWAAADSPGALRDGVPRCLLRAPDSLPRAFAAIAAQKTVPPAELLKALPAPPLRAECAAAAAFAWGRAGNEDALTQSQSMSRHERSRFVKEWHRGAPETVAPVLADADDRAAAALGSLLALAEKDPAASLSGGRNNDDIAEIAAAAFAAWVPRDSAAAWQTAETFAAHPRLASMTAALVTAESRRRSLADALPEVETLISRLHPDGPPEEVLRALVPALAAERPQHAMKYIDSLASGSVVRRAASVILFDTLSATDPAAAWRFSDTLLQTPGATDHRHLSPWASPAAQQAATALSRWDAGFPCAADVATLLGNWMQRDPAEALSTLVRQGVPEPLQAAAIEAAISPHGGAFTGDVLAKWISTLPPATQVNLEPLITKLTGWTRGKPPEKPAPKR
jgi:hypothetical protein